MVSFVGGRSHGRLAGYEDVNDADRLGCDPAMRWIVCGKAEKLLPRGSVGWLQAQDILQAAKKKE